LVNKGTNFITAYFWPRDVMSHDDSITTVMLTIRSAVSGFL